MTDEPGRPPDEPGGEATAAPGAHERGRPTGTGIDAGSPAAPEAREDREPRPIIERIGLAAIALVLAVLFGGVSAASWIGGEPFLAIMGAVGCLMTAWVGALTLVRG